MADLKEAKRTIKEMSKLLGENNLTEIEIEQDGLRIRVSRGGSFMSVAEPAAEAPAPAKEAAPENTMAKPAKFDPCEHPGCVKSPMVGTVFLAPEPGADPFVKKGDAVKKGQNLFIVEAMKVMNPITAHQDGKIKDILVDDSQPVEFDEPLCIIE